MEKAFTIQEVAARTGLSVHALRYYERAGLLPSVERAASGHRRYRTDDLNWIAFLLRLRATGMSIRQMRAYADLRRQGDTTASARLALLEAHHQQVREQMRDLEHHLAAIEQKMQHLRSMVGEEMKRKEDEQRRAPSLFSITAPSKEKKDGEIVLQHDL
jgi:DNA-binding transcriptional MerR regulator